MSITLSRKSFSLTPWIRLTVTQIKVRETCKIAVDVDRSLIAQLENNEIKHRYHPGIVNVKNVELPKNISKALARAIGDYPVKALIKDAKKLNQYIASRHPPPEKDQVYQKINEITDEIDKKLEPKNPENLTEDQAERLQKKRENIIRKTINQRTYSWKPLSYGTYESLVYAIGRGAHDYSVLMKILKELVQRDPNFRPRSYFDFGSGVGTGMWAASTLWKQSIFEYYNVDSSREMHNLSDLIIRDGNENQQPTLQNVYYRQFLPGVETKYDLILSSFSFFELPSSQNRKEVALNLWRKCDGYLIIVEEGSRKGSEIVNEVRDYLLGQTDDDLKGFVFSPCPHDHKCPRLAMAEDKTPCNFEVSYVPLEVEGVSDRRTARYSYVVLKKGSIKDDSRQWPRIVRPTLVRSKHAICRLCTSQGNLQEIIFTPSKHGRQAYKCAKASRWGDRLPIEVGEKYDKKI